MTFEFLNPTRQEPTGRSDQRDDHQQPDHRDRERNHDHERAM